MRFIIIATIATVLLPGTLDNGDHDPMRDHYARIRIVAEFPTEGYPETVWQDEVTSFTVCQTMKALAHRAENGNRIDITCDGR